MRYSGKLGIAEQTEVRPGIWEEIITEVDVLGTVKQRTETLDTSDTILPQYRTTTTSVSILARGVGHIDNSNLRYLTYAGKRWQVGSNVNAYPRLVLYLREEYNGPLPAGVAGATE